VGGRVHSFWIGRWFFGCSFGRNPKRFLRVLDTSDGRGRMLTLQLIRATFGVARYT
jgi:hypothetical protein